MTYPKHWPKPNRDCECGECDWTGQESGIAVDLFEAPDLFERLTVGHPLPAGESPECGAWAYVVTPYSQCQDAAPELLEALKELLEQLQGVDIPGLCLGLAGRVVAKARGE